MKGIVGIDEVGRGPLAGPVTVCAVYWREEISPEVVLKGIRDSKKLTAKKREAWCEEIKHLTDYLTITVASTEAEEIDRAGIMYALEKAAEQSLREIEKQHTIHHIYADYGLPLPGYNNTTHIVKGDEKHPLIALASIVAKVQRDKEMTHKAEQFKGYGFERNKGYGTKQHREAIRQKGITKLHRKTFLRTVLAQQNTIPVPPVLTRNTGI